MQGLLGIRALAMLRCGIQISKLEFQLHIFFKDGPQGPPRVTVGGRQDVVNGSVKRVTFHQEITVIRRGGSVAADTAAQTLECSFESTQEHPILKLIV
jgi:hypothetical protein